MNLLSNAVEATVASGEVHVQGSRIDGDVAIAVEDSGPGVDAAIARRLFGAADHDQGPGGGPGPRPVKRIVERHGGTIAYELRSGGGARFIVRLPSAGLRRCAST